MQNLRKKIYNLRIFLRKMRRL